MNAPFSFPFGIDEDPLARRTPRELIEAAIEALVTLLDVFEPDPDREPTMNAQGCATSGLASGDLDECEDGHDAEPDDDGEPSLGSLGSTWPPMQFAVPGQGNWSGGAADDREEEPEHAEPSLGWTTTIRQDGVNWHGPHVELGGIDVEVEHDGREPLSDHDKREQETDNGIADFEGANKQGWSGMQNWFDHVE